MTLFSHVIYLLSIFNVIHIPCHCLLHINFISSYCTKLIFFASSCFGHMFWKSSGKYNIMKTQAAYPLSVTGENISGAYKTIILFLSFRFFLKSSSRVLLYLLPSVFYTALTTSLVYKYAFQVAKRDAIQLGRLKPES
jgi:hypothetical protein